MTQISNLAFELGQQLKQQGLSISAAESCTGGLFLSTLTDVAGSSAYVQGGVVVYSNAAKQQLVNVQESTLIAQGAVSKATAQEMAQGVRRLLQSDIGISITGIAGPGGGSAEKPVGLVYIGIATADDVQAQKFLWDGDRLQNKKDSVLAAIKMIRAKINHEPA